MLRCWGTADGKLRIDVERLPSGERVQVASLDAAVDWINDRCRAVTSVVSDEPDALTAGRRPG